MKTVSKIYNAYYEHNKNHEVTTDLVERLIEEGGKQGLGHVAAMIQGNHYDDFTRIERAFMFLAMARSFQFLPYRIAFYMPVFESLFATESESVNFKVPFRIANYLGGDRKAKKETLKEIQKAYDVRSRYIHGDRINKDVAKDNKKYMQMDDLVPISKRMDYLARKVLQKVILDDAKYFLRDTNDTQKGGNIIEGLRTYLDTLTFK